MRILITVHHFPPSRVAGGELFAYRLARGLLAQGFQVQVVCVEPDHGSSRNGHVSWRDEQFDGIPVRRIGMQLHHAASDTLSYDNPALVAPISALLQADSFDLVHHISGYLLGVAPLRAAQLAGLPTIVSLTDFWFLCPTIQLRRGDASLCFGPEPLECVRCAHDSQRRFRWLDQRAPGLVREFWRGSSFLPRSPVASELAAFNSRAERLRSWLNSATVIAPVTHFLAKIHTRNGVDSSRVQVMPFGVESISVAPRMAEGSVRFGYLGQIAPIKGVELLLRAFLKLKQEERCAELFIYGNDETFPNYSRKLLELSGGERSIRWMGQYTHTDLASVLANLDVVVVPSLWHENSPHVVLEAFAAQRPVIGTDVGGISELVRDNVNGLLFPLGNINALADRMQQFLDDNTLLSRLRAQIPQVETTSAELEAWLSLYQSTKQQVPTTVS